MLVATYLLEDLEKDMPLESLSELEIMIADQLGPIRPRGHNRKAKW